MGNSDPVWFRDRWLWAVLALGLGLRLIGIGAPLIDKQAWRQTDTAAVARNFHEEGCDILHPRVDWRGTSEGYVEMNFPLYPFLVACLYGLSGGVHEWLGRGLSALFSTMAALLLYLFARRIHFSTWMARLGALLFLLFPLSVYFGRTFMPEAAMLMLSVGALLVFDRWAESGRWSDFFLSVVVSALCFLVKIPTLYLGFPLVALAWARWGWGFLKRPLLWSYLLVVLAPPVAWHFHAHRLFEQTGLTFGVWGRSGYDKWISGLLLEPDFYLLMARRFAHNLFTPAGCVLVLLGLSFGIGERRQWTVYAWLGGLLLYLLLVPEGNRRLHYYQLPFALPGALLAGRALGALLEPVRKEDAAPGWLRRAAQWTSSLRAGLVLLSLAAVGGYSAWVVQEYYHQPNELYEYYQSCYVAGRILDEKLPRNALLVVGDLDENAGAPHRAQSPTMLYYCHRKGWQITPDEFSAARLDSLAGLGADFFVSAGGFVIGNRTFWRDLVRRGITIPSEYPRFWTDTARFDQARRRHPGPDRHFVLVRLRRDEKIDK